MGVLRIGDCPLSATDEDAAFGRVVITHDALDQRAFASAVFAKERVERARPHLEFDIIECQKIAEPHRHGEGVDTECTFGKWRFADNHYRASISAEDVATAPN